MELLTKIIELVASIDWLSVSILVLVLVLLSVLIKINSSKSSKFFYDDLFLDDEGKASTSKLANLIALIISSWAFVFLTIKGSLSEWFFASYMGIWVINRAISKWADIKKDSDHKTIIDPSNKDL